MFSQVRTNSGRSSGASPSETKIPTVGLIIFLIVACYWCVLSFPRGAEYLGGDQHLILLLVLKGEDPSLFSRDLVFDNPDSIRGYIPLFLYFLRIAYRWSGDPAIGFKLMIFPLTFLYLTGAYLLLRRLGGSVSLAITVALLSSLPYSVPFSTDLFGLGPIAYMLARTFYTAASPWIFLAFAAWLDRPAHLISLFFAAGLLANLYPLSGFFLGPVLVLIYLLERRCAPRAWAVAGAAGLAVLAGALPIIRTQLQVVNRQPVAAVKFKADVAEALQPAMRYLVYPPHTMTAAPRWLVDLLTLAIAVTSIVLVTWWLRREDAWPRLPLRLVTIAALAYVLYPTTKPLLLLLTALSLFPQREEGGRRERLTVLFALSIFWVNIGGLVAVQAFFDASEFPIFSVIMNRGARYAIFAAYLLLPVFFQTADWARLATRWRAADPDGMGRRIRAVCAGLLVVALFWQFRANVRYTMRAQETVELADLAAMAKWARESTDSKAIFVFDSAAFRALARRSVVYTWKDIDVVASLRPDRAAAWAERRAILREAGSDPTALWDAGIRFGADYVVVPAKSRMEADLRSRVRYSNSTYIVLAANRESAKDRR